jgi:hypothetical protein
MVENIGQVYDIVHNIDGRWCAADAYSTTLEDVPQIIMTEYQQQGNAVERAAVYWADFDEKLKEDNPYQNLYKANETGNVYCLPYLTDEHHRVTQKWAQGQGPGLENEIIKLSLAKAGDYTAWAGVEQPENWAGQSWGNFTFSFYLINTYDPEIDIYNNFTFLYTFLRQNILERPNAIVYVPPCIYEIVIPGIKYIPVGVVNDLKITNVGAMHNHLLPEYGVKFNIPDAWRLDIGIHETILESRRLLDTVLDESYSKVSAVLK